MDVVMAAKRVFRFSYYAYLPTNEPQLEHKQRDGDAFIELLEALRDSDYRYGELLLNPPATGEPDLAPEPEVQLNADDLLVLTTRPPLDDDDDFRPKRRILRSHTVLETKILNTLRPLFARCAVDHIVLGRQLAEALTDPTIRSRSDASFWTNRSSRDLHSRSAYRAYREAHSDARRTEVDGKATPRTLAYLVLLRSQAWPGGPGLLCSFSLGGTPTLVWNHFLRTHADLTHLVRGEGSRFVLADLTMNPPASGGWLDLTPADGWQVRYESVPLFHVKSGVWTARRTVETRRGTSTVTPRVGR
jgi:hypothetical protein